MSAITAAIACTSETSADTMRESIAGYIEDRAHRIEFSEAATEDARRFAVLMIGVIASEIRAGFDAT